MAGRHPIKLIKRAERERVEKQFAGSANPELSAREKSRELAAAVKEWVSEFQQTRQREIEQQLGRSENEGDGWGRRVERDSRRKEM